MDNGGLEKISESWNELTSIVLDLEELPLSKVKQAVFESYRVLSEFCKEELVPKRISEILVEMYDFLYFATLIKDKEKSAGYYHWLEITNIADALKEGFFKGKYDCDFPKLKVCDIMNHEYITDLENDPIEKLFDTLRKGWYEKKE